MRELLRFGSSRISPSSPAPPPPPSAIAFLCISLRRLRSRLSLSASSCCFSLSASRCCRTSCCSLSRILSSLSLSFRFLSFSARTLSSSSRWILRRSASSFSFSSLPDSFSVEAFSVFFSEAAEASLTGLSPAADVSASALGLDSPSAASSSSSSSSSCNSGCELTSAPSSTSSLINSALPSSAAFHSFIFNSSTGSFPTSSSSCTSFDCSPASSAAMHAILHRLWKVRRFRCSSRFRADVRSGHAERCKLVLGDREEERKVRRRAGAWKEEASGKTRRRQENATRAAGNANLCLIEGIVQSIGITCRLRRSCCGVAEKERTRI
mmetsp:Transcript_44378/g.105150  ORF Transcript_44378/g.105150 Transcript_44378/m.105150 type:complete len:324 (-) Transcript_44378:175-1146(-)